MRWQNEQSDPELGAGWRRPFYCIRDDVTDTCTVYDHVGAGPARALPCQRFI